MDAIYEEFKKVKEKNVDALQIWRGFLCAFEINFFFLNVGSLADKCSVGSADIHAKYISLFSGEST